MYEALKGCIPNIPKLYYVLYRTDNLTNGKYYYGVHATDNLLDGYLGSGQVLKKAIKKYGKENFIRTDLEFFNSMEEAYSREAEIVTESLVKDPNCYNSKPGGLGGTKGMVTVYFQGTFQKVLLSELEHYLQLGAEKRSSLLGRPSPLKGRKQSEEHIKHRSEALKGHVGYPGRKKPEGFGEKIRRARLGAESHTEGKERIWKQGVQIFVPSCEVESKEAEGWIRTKNFRCVCKESKLPILVPRENISQYLKEGYVKVTYSELNRKVYGR